MVTRLNNNSISSITALPSGVGGITMADQWRITANTSSTFLSYNKLGKN